MTTNDEKDPLAQATEELNDHRPGLLTVQQAAAHFQVQDRTIRTWISEGKMKATKLGARAIRIPRSEIAYISKHGLRR